jgi:hypothetical protein
MRSAGRLACGVAALLAAACAHGPDPLVREVRGEYERAAADPLVNEHAPLGLDDARQAVVRLERADAQGAVEVELQHLAYLARQEIEIARARAAAGALRERAEGLEETRDQLLEAGRSGAQSL